jgi:hypothetical protein
MQGFTVWALLRLEMKMCRLVSWFNIWKHEIHPDDFYKVNSYSTENTLRVHYKRRHVNAAQANMYKELSHSVSSQVQAGSEMKPLTCDSVLRAQGRGGGQMPMEQLTNEY